MRSEVMGVPIRLGEKIPGLLPSTWQYAKREDSFWWCDPAKVVAKVCYIHPEERFFTVEFTLAGGRFRESITVRGGVAQT